MNRKQSFMQNIGCNKMRIFASRETLLLRNFLIMTLVIGSLFHKTWNKEDGYDQTFVAEKREMKFR